jgi:regulatory protein
MSHQTERDEPLQAGTVTRIETQNDPDRVSVFIDGAFAFELPREVAREYDVAEGRTLSVEEQQRLIAEEAARRARSKALQYLTGKPRTAEEVRRNLRKNDHSETAIEDALAWLREHDYVDDAAYAQRYAQQRFDSKGYGPRRIRHELKKRGVDKRHTDRALDEAIERDEALEHARSHARKRLSRLERDEPNPWKRRKKLSDYLLRRGFTHGMIREVVREVAEREEW